MGIQTLKAQLVAPFLTLSSNTVHMFLIMRKIVVYENDTLLREYIVPVYSSKSKERIDWIWVNHADVLKDQEISLDGPECIKYVTHYITQQHSK